MIADTVQDPKPSLGETCKWVALGIEDNDKMGIVELENGKFGVFGLQNPKELEGFKERPEHFGF